MTKKRIADGSCFTHEIDVDVVKQTATFKMPDEEFSNAHQALKKLLRPMDWIGHHLGAAQISAFAAEWFGYSWQEEYESKAINDRLTIGPFQNILLEYEATQDVGDCLERIHIRPQYSNKRVNLWRSRKRVKCWWADFYFKTKPKDGSLKVKFV